MCRINERSNDLQHQIKMTAMRNPFNNQSSAQKRHASSSGFSMVETLISGLVVAAVMTAVGRLGVSAMATSHNQSSRNSIEAAINDHIQLVQMQDSYLTAEANRSRIWTQYQFRGSLSKPKHIPDDSSSTVRHSRDDSKSRCDHGMEQQQSISFNTDLRI